MSDYQDPGGFALLQDPHRNKSTAFSEAERERYKLRGLLPAAVSTQAGQVRRALGILEKKSSDIERYHYLRSLQDRNERLFYRLALDHIETILPLIYTPTVGQACAEYTQNYRQPRGFYITPKDKGRIREMLDNWPQRDVRVIVVTDGERILGLGDLGANGMGIPIGKLSLYVACAGIHPQHCLPITLDVGTENQAFRNDPLYIGLAEPRLRGEAYEQLVDEFIAAAQDAFPGALIQFEDFSTTNAYRILGAYRQRAMCFNDDIQGTAAVALAGVFAATRITQDHFKDLRVLFLGAGSASTGIAELMVSAFTEAGLSEAQARERLWLCDSRGLVVKGRNNVKEHARPYAQDRSPMGFMDALRALKPQVLIGATGQPGMFTQEAVALMAELNQRPIVFALSNPTSRAECTAQQAYRWSDGRAVFASGSPFPAVVYKNQTHRPGQGNNSYIFPGVGLGAVVSQTREVTDAMFLAATKVLAAMVDEQDLATGTVYPPLTEIREVSLAIAEAVAEQAYDGGLARAPRPEGLRQAIADYMYDPSY